MVKDINVDHNSIRESIEKDYGKLEGPMTLEEFISELDSLDNEDEES